MTSEPISPETPPTPEPPKQQHSLAARLLAALAFSTVGAKIGFIGMIPDAKDLCKDMTWGQKLKGALNLTLFTKIINEEAPAIMAKEKIGLIAAYSKLFKYT